MKPSTAYWIAVPATAIVHNVWAAATGREQLCDAMDRYRGAQPILVNAAILLTAAHVSRRWPSWAAPWAWMFATAAYALGRHRPVEQLTGELAEVIPIDINAVI